MPTDITTVKPYFGKTAAANQTASRTIREYLANYIFQHGVFADQVEKILDGIAADPVHSAVASMFTSKWTDYPPMLYNLTLANVRACVVKWIDDNIPQAWYRSMFVDE